MHTLHYQMHPQRKDSEAESEAGVDEPPAAAAAKKKTV